MATFSTVPVVEAMRRLESEGLLVKQARKMAKVRELSATDPEGLYLLREGLGCPKKGNKYKPRSSADPTSFCRRFPDHDAQVIVVTQRAFLGVVGRHNFTVITLDA